MGIKIRTCPNQHCVMLILNSETTCPYCSQPLTPLVEKSDDPTKH